MKHQLTCLTYNAFHLALTCSRVCRPWSVSTVTFCQARMETPTFIECRLLSAPREIRDLIYLQVLSCGQKIHLPLSVNTHNLARYTSEKHVSLVFEHKITHPRLKRPNEYVSVRNDISYLPISCHAVTPPSLFRSAIKEVADQSAPSRWHVLHQLMAKKLSTDNLAIVRTCKQIFNEISPMVYPNCTFHFPFNAPLAFTTTDTLRNPLLAQIQHIELHLDLVTAYLRHYSTAAECDVVGSWCAYLHHFCGAMDKAMHAKSCTLIIEYREDAGFLELLAPKIAEMLRPFNLVTIKLSKYFLSLLIASSLPSSNHA